MLCHDSIFELGIGRSQYLQDDKHIGQACCDAHIDHTQGCCDRILTCRVLSTVRYEQSTLAKGRFAYCKAHS